MKNETLEEAINQLGSIPKITTQCVKVNQMPPLTDSERRQWDEMTAVLKGRGAVHEFNDGWD